MGPSPAPPDDPEPHSLLLPDLAGLAGPGDWLKGWVKAVGPPTELPGYQLWAVQQRLTERDVLMPVVIVLTGHSTDKVTLTRYHISSSIPPSSRPSHWSATTSALKAAGCRLSQLSTSLWIPLTTLPSLAQSLTILHLPGGDFLAIRDTLFQAINLRRLGLGGRSGLQLAPATPAQYLHLKQVYRLPVPGPTPHNSLDVKSQVGGGSLSVVRSRSPSPTRKGTGGSGTSGGGGVVGPDLMGTATVLGLVRVVQHGLSLYGLGAVMVETGTILAEALGISVVVGGLSTEPATRKLSEGDGLLCDLTIAGLDNFKYDIAEPLLSITSDDSTLPPQLLAALLSTVIAARAKLASLNVPAVPKDPFERRAKFSRAVRAFQRQHKLDGLPFLSLGLLRTLQELYAKAESISRLNLPGIAGRALRSRLDEHANALPGRAAAALLGHGEEAETSSMDALFREVERGAGGNTVGRLWGVRAAKKHKDGKTERDKEGEATDAGAVTSEGEGLHGLQRGLGVLSSVRRGAGRAVGRIGDNLGLTDNTAPSLVVSPDTNTREPSPEPSTERSRHGHGPSASASLSSNLLSLPNAFTKSRKGSVESLGSDWTNVRSPLSLAPSTGSAGATSPLSLNGGLPARTVSEAFVGTATRKINGLGIDSYDYDLALSASDVSFLEEDDDPAAIVSHGKRPPVRRRHTVNLTADAPRPWQWLAPRRLELDVKLRTTAFALARQERELADLLAALRTVKASYATALVSLREPVAARQTHVRELEGRARALQDHVDSLLAPGSDLAALGERSQRMAFSQNLVEEKTQEVLAFRRNVIGRLAEGGEMDRETRAFEEGGRGDKGMRSLVNQLERGGAFYAHVRGRVWWYLVGQWVGGGGKGDVDGDEEGKVQAPEVGHVEGPGPEEEVIESERD